MGDRVAAAAQPADRDGDHGGSDETVDAVHDAAMARDEIARILDAEPPLDRRFRNIAALPRCGQQPTEGRERVRVALAQKLGGRSADGAAPATPPIRPDQVLFGEARGPAWGRPASGR